MITRLLLKMALGLFAAATGVMLATAVYLVVAANYRGALFAGVLAGFGLLTLYRIVRVE